MCSWQHVDLFAGIGGFRLGLSACGAETVWGCDSDKFVRQTYKAWYGDTLAGDIRDINPQVIPDHDILTAGFPCQPFSSAGRKGGFADEQGNLFFNIVDILAAQRPPVFILENVKHLRSHDRGNTWAVIRGALEDLNYSVYYDVIDASLWVPQRRERIFIVGFDRKVFGDFVGFSFCSVKLCRYNCLWDDSSSCLALKDILESDVSGVYTLSDSSWNTLQQHKERHKNEGNGFGFWVADLDGISRTLVSTYYKGSGSILIPQKNKNPRRLTPREAARLMGFTGEYAVRCGFIDGEFPIVVSDTQAYRQFGNAVVPAVVEAVGWAVVDIMNKKLRSRK